MAKVKIGRKMQGAVIQRWGYYCWYCGRDLTADNGTKARVTIDHQTPRSRGGLTQLGNLVPACASCNAQKRSRTVEEYRAWLCKSNRAAVLIEQALSLHNTPFDVTLDRAVRWLQEQEPAPFFGEKATGVVFPANLET